MKVFDYCTKGCKHTESIKRDKSLLIIGLVLKSPKNGPTIHRPVEISISRGFLKQEWNDINLPKH